MPAGCRDAQRCPLHPLSPDTFQGQESPHSLGEELVEFVFWCPGVQTHSAPSFLGVSTACLARLNPALYKEGEQVQRD
jgi:hypothetical protein